MDATYLFIDGGYLRECYREAMVDFFGEEGELDFSEIKQRIGAQKAFYYDCLHEEQRTGESAPDFEERKKRQKEAFNNIRALRGYHVREGTLSGRRQKEVDVALAVDMLTHAFYHNYDEAVLIAGDLDFRPVVESLIRLGRYVRVLSARFSPTSAGSKLLHWAADDAEEITILTLHGWSTEAFKNTHPLPRASVGTVPLDGFRPRRKGCWNGHDVVLYERGRDFTIWVDQPGGGPLTFAYPGDLDRLEKYFRLLRGPIEWL